MVVTCLGRWNPISADRYTHRFVVGSDLVANERGRYIECVGDLKHVQRSLELAAMHLGHVGKALQNESVVWSARWSRRGAAKARPWFRRFSSSSADHPQGAKVTRAAEARATNGANRGLLCVRHTKRKVATVGTHHHRHTRLLAPRQHSFRCSQYAGLSMLEPGAPGIGLPLANLASTSFADAPASNFPGGNARSGVSAYALSPAIPTFGIGNTGCLRICQRRKRYGLGTPGANARQRENGALEHGVTGRLAAEDR